ncbi:MAG: allantoinase AllB [Bacteroidota bacterium]
MDQTGSTHQPAINGPTVIYSRNVVFPERTTEATLFLEEGRITKILLEKLASTKTLPVKDYGDSFIMPGLIDCHVHINDPGRTDWEGFETATQAAAAGGITTLIDMPLNSSPVTTTAHALEMKLNAAEGNLMVHCGFWGGIIPGNQKEIEPLILAGVMGFKVFLTHSGIDEFPNITLKELEESLPLLAKYNLPLLVHAELDKKHVGQKELEADNYSYRAWLHSRPRSWENEAIKGMINLCKKHNVRTHIVHLSSAEALQLIKDAKSNDIPLTVETCPHYLYFSAEKIPDSDTRFKCAPPIREEENNRLLWNAVCDGTIDFVVTDHSPAPPELKELETGNLKMAWGGIASLQFSLQVIWTLAKQDGRSIEDVTRWMSTAVADFLGMKNKGRITEGADADLVIWSPSKKMKVNRTNIKFRHKVTPYEGEMLYGVIEETWVGGNKVYDKGAFVSSPAGNKLLKQNERK